MKRETLTIFMRREETARRLVLLSLLYALPALQALQVVIDPDIWWHLRTGQWIIEHGAFPRVDEFSSYGLGKPWVAYSWLFELVVYGLYKGFGLTGIILYSLFFSLLITWALHALIRKFALGFLAEVALTAMTLVAMAPGFTPRPWLFTLLFFIIEVDLIFTARRQGEVRRLFLLPPLFIIWANVHIQFCYGLFVLGLATVEPIIALALSRLRQETVSEKTLPLFSLSMVLLACIAATFATPYHWRLYSTLFSLVGQTSQFRDIIEMHSLAFDAPWDWCVLALALLAAFSLGRRHQLRPFPILLLITGALLSFRARRDAWFVVIAAATIIAETFSTTPSTDRFPITWLRAAICAGMVLGVLLIIGWYRNLSERRLEAVVAMNYPVAAVAAVQERGYSGPLYNDFDWGGFLIWRLRTPLVVMDNRGDVHGGARIQQSLKTWSGSRGWDADPELAAARLVIANAQSALASLLRLDPRFDLVYEDEVATVFTASPPLQEQKTARLTLQ